MTIKYLRIRTQFMLGLIIPLFFVIMLGVVAYMQSYKLQKQTERLYHYPLVEGRAIGTLRSDIYGLARDMKDLSLTDDDKKLSVEMDWIKWWQEDAVRNIELIDSLYLGPRDDVDLLIQHFDSLLYICHQTIDLKMSGRKEEVLSRITTMGIVTTWVERLLKQLQVIDILSIKQGDELYEQSLELGDSLNKQLVLLVAAILLVSFMLNFVLLGNVGKPLAELTDAAQRFHEGDKNARSSYVSQNEFGILSASFNKLVEEATRREISSVEAVFESSPVAMLIIDETTNIVMANLAAIVLCGVGESDILQHRPGNALRCVHSSKDSRGCGYSKDCKLCSVRNGVEALITNGGSMHGAEVELQLIRNGEPRKTWLSVGVEPLVLRGSRHWCIALEDITERKRAEDALAESEKKLRALFETMSEGIVYEDHDGNIISANPAAERLLGLSLDQMQGRSSLDPRWKAIHEDGSPFPGETHSLNVAAKTGKPAIGEVMGIFNPKLDSYVWLSVNSTPEYLPGEKIPFRAYAVFRDITEHKIAVEKLEKSEKQYRLLFDEMLSGFAVHEIICDQSGTPSDYRFLSVNKAFEKMTGLDACSILGKTVLEVMPGIESSWIERYGKVALTGEPTQFENYAVALGKHYEVRAYCPEHGKFATLINDTTDRKRAEEKLLQQLNELRRWQEMTLGREDRVRQLKSEVNQLLSRLGETILYPSQGSVSGEQETAKPG